MQARNRSPRINHVSWGRLEVEGKVEAYKDAKLFPGGSRDWNWRETGTSHTPGIQIADVQDLLDHGATVVVLSRGMAECLHVPRETLDFLTERQIVVHGSARPTSAVADGHPDDKPTPNPQLARTILCEPDSSGRS
jgi:hypothetical protein